MTRLRALLGALLTLLAVAAVTVVVSDNGNEGPRATVTIHVDGADADKARDDKLILGEPAQKVLEDLTGVPAEAVPEGDIEATTLREPSDTGPVGVVEGPLAAQEFPGCRTAFVGNYSSRNGSIVLVIVWHYTVSEERGRASQDGLTAYANRPSSGVSWHFLIGRSNGLCTFSVPLHMKAWTQGNANPFSFGIEVEATGNEGVYVTGAGERKLLAVTRELGRRFDIPMRRGRVENCRPVRSGIVTHAELGACGGGHHDIGPFTDAPRLIAKLRPPAITATDRTTCRKLNSWRRAGRPKGGQWERNSVRRRRTLAARSVTCRPRGPVRESQTLAHRPA